MPHQTCWSPDTRSLQNLRVWKEQTGGSHEPLQAENRWFTAWKLPVSAPFWLTERGGHRSAPGSTSPHRTPRKPPSPEVPCHAHRSISATQVTFTQVVRVEVIQIKRELALFKNKYNPESIGHTHEVLRKGIQTDEPTRRTEQILVWQYASEQYVQNKGTIFIYEHYGDARKKSEQVRKELLNRRKKKLKCCRGTWAPIDK